MGTVYKRPDRGGRRGNYYASFIDENGNRIRFNTGTTDKQTAVQVLAARQTKAAKRREGITDPQSERVAEHSKKSLGSHVADFVTYLKARNRSDVHITRQQKRIDAIIQFAGWRRLSDIEPSKVDDFVSKLKAGAEGKRAKLDASTTTKAHYRTAIKSFTSWLASPESGRRISFDPLARTGGGKRTKERRLRRRAIMVAEWQAIQKHVTAESFGIGAAERLLAYELALQTGLRASEIHSLKRSRLKLTGESPSVVVPSDTTKDSIDAHQHITPELAVKLRAHVSRKAAGAIVFALPHAANLADMIRADMNAAREAWLDTSNDDEATKKAKAKVLAEHPDFLQTTDSNGERVDFHALRHTCGAWLALAGVHPKTIQSVMRHKDIKLTLDTYGHLFRSMEADAVQKMAAMIAGSEPESLIDSAGLPG